MAIYSSKTTQDFYSSIIRMVDVSDVVLEDCEPLELFDPHEDDFLITEVEEE